MAMLRVAVSRLRALWPDAVIQVLSDTPEELSDYCPEGTPLSTRGRRAWFEKMPHAEGISRCLPVALRVRMRRFDRWLRKERPALRAQIARRAFRAWGNDGVELTRFLDAVRGADLLVVTGMGGVTDAFPRFARELLDVLGLAIAMGRPTAMLGQGMGPLENAQLRQRARAVLPQVDLIALREERMGGTLLQSLGVRPDRMMTTGDDAIEIAYERRPVRPGQGLGINLRASSYSRVDSELVGQVRAVLDALARRRPDIWFVPLPVSLSGEPDTLTINRLIGSHPMGSDAASAIDNPLELIERTKECRAVVTGSYHAGLFALSMGIPVVGLAASAYYRSKFLGLQAQFGVGCTLVHLDEAGFADRLTAAIDHAWDRAENERPAILAAAARQIELSWAAYRKLETLVRGGRA